MSSAGALAHSAAVRAGGPLQQPPFRVLNFSDSIILSDGTDLVAELVWQLGAVEGLVPETLAVTDEDHLEW